MTFFSDERANELRQLFFESAHELLQSLNEEGLELEKHPGDAEIIREVRRTVHTLKGDSAACGYSELSKLAHELEDVLTPELAQVRSTALSEVVLTAADTFQAMLAAYRNSLQPPSGDELRAHIHKLVSEPAAPRTAPAEARFAWSEYEQMTISDAVSRGEKVHNVALYIDPDCPLRAASLQLARNVLQGSGTVLALRLDDQSSPDDANRIEAALICNQPKEWIIKRCQIPAVVTGIVVERITGQSAAGHDLLGILLEQEAAAVAAESPAQPSTPAGETTAEVAASAAPIGGEAAPSGAPAAATASESVLRVDASRVDILLNLVGELIIGKSMLYQAVREFEVRYPKEPLRGKFADTMAFQSRVLDELQKSVMKIRMVPVEQLFRRFPRIVRDVSKLQGKEVALAITGQATDLDKSIQDSLAEPLSHLVRNAVDHGIESPEERKASGKSAKGIVRLSAYHQGNQAVIEVCDDGRGIAHEKIIARAVEIGIVPADDAARMTRAEALDLIFKPGFSTAKEITEISGRGVGLDVVRNAVERLKGSVSVESQPGRGTTFILRVPLTLTSTKALLFRAGDRLYAVPLASVVEITRATEPEIHRVDNHEVLQLRNQILTLVRLNRLAPNAPAICARRLFVIVVAVAERKFGLAVDNLAGEEELVIKALDNHLIASDLVSGASILGDGTVVLVLNLPAVVAKLSRAPLLEATA